MAKDKKKMFRKWMSYNAAKLTMRDYGVQSRKQYWDWWDSERPRALPKFPNRVYEEWTNWSDFLGGEKVTFHHFTGPNGQRRSKIKVRPYHEAIRWMHAQNFTSFEQYNQAYRDKKLPPDFPIDPQKHYEEWVSWPHWFGKDIKAKIEAAKTNLGILALCIPTDMAGGFIRPVIVNDGWVALKETITKERTLRVIKMYQWKPENVTMLDAILTHYGRKKEGDLWLVSNLHDVISALDERFDWFTPPVEQQTPG
jgi:hypothetical protein